MRWKLVRTLLLAGLILLSAFVALMVRAEWFLHVVARKEFLWPSDAPHPYRMTAEIRRVWSQRDWRSLFYHDPGIYMRYECRIRDSDEVITSARWVFADHPQPSVYSITPSKMDTPRALVVFNLDGQVVNCTFGDFTHWHWDIDERLAPPF